MFWNQLFARKSLEMLHAEEEGEHRLRRILGPVQLTALGVGAIIGAGIFVMTGRAATQDAGPAIMLSYCVAGLGCALAAFCYAEFASMAPVAGSAYTYAYATLGEVFAWIIGWDLILEYAMSCACVASAWTNYFNTFLITIFDIEISKRFTTDPFTYTGGGFALNLPAVCIMVLVTYILVIGIRESATTNAILTAIKLGVVLFVIAVGFGYMNTKNWTEIPMTERRTPVESYVIPDAVKEEVGKDNLSAGEQEKRVAEVTKLVSAAYRLEFIPAEVARLKDKGKLTQSEADETIAKNRAKYEPVVAGISPEDKELVEKILVEVRQKAPALLAEKWGMLAYLGLNKTLNSIDDGVRSNFFPFGISGLMLGASIVFFAFIGFDSISAHSEEAMKPQRDVPIGIIASLVICTTLYLLVSGIITAMVPYTEINTKAAIAAAFSERAKIDNNPVLHYSAALISTGALAGMTSVLLITFLSQARIFLAMARDGLLPQSVFATIHPKFRTPYISTIMTGTVICLLAAFTPIEKLEEMVNIGTLLAFVIVCGAVWLLRIRRPEAKRPFRSPFIHVVAPLGILVNLTMMLFLPLDTWLRLVIWLAIGLVIYFAYSFWHSRMGLRSRGLIPKLSLAGVPSGDGQVSGETGIKKPDLPDLRIQ